MKEVVCSGMSFGMVFMWGLGDVGWGGFGKVDKLLGDVCFGLQWDGGP